MSFRVVLLSLAEDREDHKQINQSDTTAHHYLATNGAYSGNHSDLPDSQNPPTHEHGAKSFSQLLLLSKEGKKVSRGSASLTFLQPKEESRDEDGVSLNATRPIKHCCAR